MERIRKIDQSFGFSTLEEFEFVSVNKVPCVHGAVAPGEPLVAALEEFDIVSVNKVPCVHGAEAPGEPLAAAFYSRKTTLSPLRRSQPDHQKRWPTWAKGIVV